MADLEENNHINDKTYEYDQYLDDAGYRFFFSKLSTIPPSPFPNNS